MFIREVFGNMLGEVDVARALDDIRLQDRSVRARLKPRHHPYWRCISQGCHIGLYKGARSSTWIARYRAPGTDRGYDMLKLGEVGDREGMIVNDDAVLDWQQALKKAQKLVPAKVRWKR